MHATTYRSLHRQRGLSYTGVLVMLSAAIFFGLFAIKVGPLYMQHMTVTSIAENLVSKPDLLQQSRSKIYKHINQAYRTNNLWDLKAEETIKLERGPNRGFTVTVAYERRATLFRNIDVVTTFNNEPVSK